MRKLTGRDFAAILALTSGFVLPPSTAFAACGVERWSVKTGVDADARQVDLKHVKPGTITELIAIAAPAAPPSAGRVKPYELNVYSIDAVMTLIRAEKDSDFHLVLSDPQGKTLIAEIPSSACVGAGSPFARQIANVRGQFERKFPGVSSAQVKVPVRVQGVAFFDRQHGQTGVAPNGFELHPILDIQFLQGKVATRLLAQTPDPKFSQRELNVDEDEDADQD